MVTIGVGILIQLRVPCDEPPNLRVVESGSNVNKPCIPIIPVPAVSRELIGIRAAARSADGQPERIHVDRAGHDLAAVGDAPLTPQPIEQWILPVFTDQLVPISIGRLERAALLLVQNPAGTIVEDCGGSAVRPAVSA